MKLILKIAYRGENFAGYQFQPDKRTVQGSLTEAFSAALGFEVKVTGCSRTDAGVHALGFVCSVEPKNASDEIKIPPGKFHRAAEKYLPPDVGIAGEAEVGDDFHPRYSVSAKSYRYLMYDSPARDPFLTGLAWQLKKPIPDGGIEKMNRCAQKLVGRHDFTSFMASGSRITDASREIFSLSVGRDINGRIALEVSADGFLYNMVRIITGTLVDAAYGLFDEADIEKILASRDRSSAGKTSPPDGLYLAEVNYPFSINWTLL